MNKQTRTARAKSWAAKYVAAQEEWDASLSESDCKQAWLAGYRAAVRDGRKDRTELEILRSLHAAKPWRHGNAALRYLSQYPVSDLTPDEAIRRYARTMDLWGVGLRMRDDPIQEFGTAPTFSMQSLNGGVIGTCVSPGVLDCDASPDQRIGIVDTANHGNARTQDPQARNGPDAGSHPPTVPHPDE